MYKENSVAPAYLHSTYPVAYEVAEHSLRIVATLISSEIGVSTNNPNFYTNFEKIIETDFITLLKIQINQLSIDIYDVEEYAAAISGRRGFNNLVYAGKESQDYVNNLFSSPLTTTEPVSLYMVACFTFICASGFMRASVLMKRTEDIGLSTVPSYFSETFGKYAMIDIKEAFVMVGIATMYPDNTGDVTGVINGIYTKFGITPNAPFVNGKQLWGNTDPDIVFVDKLILIMLYYGTWMGANVFYA